MRTLRKLNLTTGILEIFSDHQCTKGYHFCTVTFENGKSETWWIKGSEIHQLLLEFPEVLLDGFYDIDHFADHH